MHFIGTISAGTIYKMAVAFACEPTPPIAFVYH